MKSSAESKANMGPAIGPFPRQGRGRQIGLMFVALNLVLLPAAVQISASTRPQVSSGASPKSPAIFFDQTFHDFGKIPYEQVSVHRFKVSNRGGGELHLIEVKPSCGCTSTIVGKDSLQPGESTEIEINFKPENASGFIRKSLLVTSDDPVHSVMTLFFKADVLPALPSDQRTVSFREVDRTAQRFERIRLAATPGQSLNVGEIFLGDAAHLSVFPKPDGDSTILEIVLDGSKLPVGELRGQNVITVTTTGDSIARIPILVSWATRLPPEARPDSIKAAAR